MGIIDDMLEALDGIPVWARLRKVPDEISELQGRIAALEEKLGDKWPADVCRYCGERAVRLKRSFGPDTKRLMHENWECAVCGRTDVRLC